MHSTQKNPEEFNLLIAVVGLSHNDCPWHRDLLPQALVMPRVSPDIPVSCHPQSTHANGAQQKVTEVFTNSCRISDKSLLLFYPRLTGQMHANKNVDKLDFTCDICGYRSSSMTELKTHLNLFHPDKKSHMVKNKMSKHR